MESCPTDSPSPQQGRLPLPWPPVTKRILSREHQWLRKLYSTMTSSLSNLSVIQLVKLFIPIALVFVLPVHSLPSPGGSSFGGVVRLPRYINNSLISVSNQLRPAVFLENIARGTWDPGVDCCNQINNSKICVNSPQDSNNLFTNAAVWLHLFEAFSKIRQQVQNYNGEIGLHMKLTKKGKDRFLEAPVSHTLTQFWG